MTPLKYLYGSPFDNIEDAPPSWKDESSHYITVEWCRKNSPPNVNQNGWAVIYRSDKHDSEGFPYTLDSPGQTNNIIRQILFKLDAAEEVAQKVMERVAIPEAKILLENHLKKQMELFDDIRRD